MPHESPEKSIALLLTPPGSAAIAVVRLAGPAVAEFLRLHFSKPLKIGRCVHGELRDEGRILDDAVVVLVNETTADLNLHGGTWIVQSVLDLARRAGFGVSDRVALPLPPEVVDAISPLEAEILAHLPLVRTELGLRVLLAQTQQWEQLRMGAVAADQLRQILADRSLDCLLHPRRVAIVGPANVGKSTLANQLFTQERSITADVPGTTRDWVGEIANIDGLPILLLDTPGMRETNDPIEAEAIRRSGGEIRQAHAIILVLDASRPMQAEQQRLLNEFPQAIRVLNKADLSHDPGATLASALRTVATRGDGIDALRRQIVRTVVGHEPIEIDRPRCWTDRQRAILENAIVNPNALQDL